MKKPQSLQDIHKQLREQNEILLKGIDNMVRTSKQLDNSVAGGYFCSTLVILRVILEETMRIREVVDRLELRHGG